MKKNKIIENTEEAKEYEDNLYGSFDIFLTDEEINALQKGKCVKTTINDEYVIFIEKD